MNETQTKLLELSKTIDISNLGVRELARKLGVHPQTAKYHKEKLEQAGLLKHGKGLFNDIEVERQALGGADLVTIPFLGAANCGPAALIAGAAADGKITVSSRLLPTTNYQALFALRADGHSMNQASVHGSCIENGDYIVVDSSAQPAKGDYVVAVVNNLANIKRYYPEYDQHNRLSRITLVSESSEQFEPIFIHPDDAQEGLIAGIVVQVIPKPPQLPAQ